jgi:hypothetical protein
VAWVLVALGLVVLAGVLFARGERRRGEALCRLAEAEERQGRPDVACYYYAAAAAAGERRHACEARIRELWERHGPFDLDAVGRRVHEAYCRYGSCGEGFHELTAREIRRVVGAEAGSPPPP